MPAAAKKKQTKARRRAKAPERETRDVLYGFLTGQPHQTPSDTLVRLGPTLTSNLWEVTVIMNMGAPGCVDLEIRPRPNNRAGFKNHSLIEDGVTFDCRVEAVLDLARILHDAAHVMGRLGAPVAAGIDAEG